MCVAEKILATILNNILMHWIKINSKVSDLQGAFQKGKGADDFLLLLNMLLNQSIKNSGTKKVYILQLDIEKAFDRVWR